jgi:anaerobic magnesium-protoporphyrin IX monomethyl ester cyclase
MYRGLGRIVRKRSVENVLAEVKQVTRRYPTDYVRFADDTFAHGVDAWLEEFSRRYPQEIGLPFYCLVRANSVSADLVKLLREAGCRSACMSIESANPHIREEILNRRMTNEQIVAAFDYFNEAGIHLYTNSMLGLPTATMADEVATVELNIRCRPAYGNFSVATPFPGTEMFEYCQKAGLLPTDLEPGQIRSTGQESVLTSFTPAEKRFQNNLYFLGPLAIKFPLLKGLIVRHLARLPANPAYFLVHYLLKNYLFMKYIVPIRFGWRDFIVLGLSQLKAEWRSRSISLRHRHSARQRE